LAGEPHPALRKLLTGRAVKKEDVVGASLEVLFGQKGRRESEAICDPTGKKGEGRCLPDKAQRMLGHTTSDNGRKYSSPSVEQTI